jgi:hypothetical protein
MLLCATMWLNIFLRNTTFNYNIYLSNYSGKNWLKSSGFKTFISIFAFIEKKAIWKIFYSKMEIYFRL